jgi:hypothetical protein
MPSLSRRLAPAERHLAKYSSGRTAREKVTGVSAEDDRPSAGLGHWTDGGRWYGTYVRTMRVHLRSYFIPSSPDDRSRSQSRMRESLHSEGDIYKQPEEETTKMPRSQNAQTPSHPSPDSDRPSKPGGLTRQTYSCKTSCPEATLSSRNSRTLPHRLNISVQRQILRVPDYISK